jgi:hypothetical protein
MLIRGYCCGGEKRYWKTPTIYCSVEQCYSMAPILKDMPYWLHVTGDLYVALFPIPVKFSKVTSRAICMWPFFSPSN